MNDIGEFSIILSREQVRDLNKYLIRLQKRHGGHNYRYIVTNTGMIKIYRHMELVEEPFHINDISKVLYEDITKILK